VELWEEMNLKAQKNHHPNNGNLQEKKTEFKNKKAPCVSSTMNSLKFHHKISEYQRFKKNITVPESI
jgi:hypothetical protein